MTGGTGGGRNNLRRWSGNSREPANLGKPANSGEIWRATLRRCFEQSFVFHENESRGSLPSSLRWLFWFCAKLFIVCHYLFSNQFQICHCHCRFRDTSCLVTVQQTRLFLFNSLFSTSCCIFCLEVPRTASLDAVGVSN